MCIHVLCPFLNGLFVFLVLTCMSSLYILDIILLSAIVNQAYHFIIYIFLTTSLTMQKLFSLMWPNLFIFAFVSLAWRDISKIRLLRPMPVFFWKKTYAEVCDPFSSGRKLTLKSVIHFLLEEDLRWSLWSILCLFLYMTCESGPVWCLACSCPLFPAPLLKSLSFHTVYPCVLCSRLIDPGSVGLFPLLLHWSTCLFLHQYHTVLLTIALWYGLKLRNLISPALLFFPKIILNVQGHLCFYTNFSNDLFLFCEKCHWYLGRDGTEFGDCFG